MTPHFDNAFSCIFTGPGCSAASVLVHRSERDGALQSAGLLATEKVMRRYLRTCGNGIRKDESQSYRGSSAYVSHEGKNGCRAQGLYNPAK